MPHSSTTVSLESARSQDSFRATTAPTLEFASSSKWEGQRGRVPKKIPGSISVKFHRFRALKTRIKREMRLRKRGALPVIRIHGSVTQKSCQGEHYCTHCRDHDNRKRKLHSGRSTSHAPGDTQHPRELNYLSPNGYGTLVKSIFALLRRVIRTCLHHRWANSLVDVCGAALKGIADQSRGALKEKRAARSLILFSVSHEKCVSFFFFFSMRSKHSYQG